MAEYLKESCSVSSRESWSCAGPSTAYYTGCYCTAPSGEGKESSPTSTMATDTTAEPEQRPMPAAVATVKKKKSKTKSILSGSEKMEAGSSKPVEETGWEIITWSLCLGEPLLTWLLQYWDTTASSVAPGGSEAKQLGSLSWGAVIDQGIRRTPETFSLCRQL